jgi:hypothetical protein
MISDSFGTRIWTLTTPVTVVDVAVCVDVTVYVDVAVEVAVLVDVAVGVAVLVDVAVGVETVPVGV